ncbi:hypothetical protein ACFQJ8_22715 [Halocatena marina]|uniref:hypothetical protein n=1 Tax=Halocatena marina TaxID=2934937 RepID=UPI0036225798
MSDGNNQGGPNEPAVISSVKRRRMLKILGLSSTFGLAGCMGGGDNAGDSGNNNSSTAAPPRSAESTQQSQLPAHRR